MTSRKNLPKILVVFVCVIFGGAQLWGKDDASSYEDFVNAIGEMLYFVAWPTAEYGGVSYEGLSPAGDGVDIRIKLYGKSAFSGDSLWTEVVVKVRDGEISGINWGRNNAILAQPAGRARAFAAAVKPFL